MTTRGSGDDLWEEFVREFERENAAREPIAAEQAQPPVRRRSRGRLLLPLGAALLVAAGAAAYLLRPPAPAAAPVSSAPVSSAPASPVTASSAPSPTGSRAAASDVPTAAIPLSVFPAQLQGYTLVADIAVPSCTGSETVAPTLAGLIVQGHGCLGIDLALYRDAEGNQYNLALFTMKDQGDIAHLLTVMGSHPEAFQVAVHVPPEDSGLRRLPADSGLVQSFAAYGHGMLIGMAQWSDGRTADLDRLTKQLSPLTEAVIQKVPA